MIKDLVRFENELKVVCAEGYLNVSSGRAVVVRLSDGI